MSNQPDYSRPKSEPMFQPATLTYSDKQILEWAERHNIQGSISSLREAFEDAATTALES